MSGGGLAVVLFVALLLGGMWIPFALGAAGLILLAITDGWRGLNALGLITWGSVNSFTLTAIPMFLLMAELLLRSGVSHRVYAGLSTLVRRLPGGLLQTNVIGCAVFAAISGSSVATAAGIGTVALPQLLSRGYDRRLSAGTLAAGGTLGILIPPSIAMILYGTFTETSIARLFIAGLLPGLVLTGMFSIYVAGRALMNPAVAPKEEGPADPFLTTMANLAPFAVLIAVVLGGIYLGFVTPTEAGAVGSLMALIIGRVWGRLGWADFMGAVSASVRVSAALLLIVLAAYIFAYALENAGIASELAKWMIGLELSRTEFLIAIFILYAVLGCFIDSIGMMVLTVPLLFPVLPAYDIDVIWFGVVVVILIELGQITPPLGINLFVIQGIWTGKLGEVVRGSLPFYAIMVLFVGLLALFPGLALLLPSRMGAG
ncbi:MAG: TRAP transporter large permease [Pseudomonadota bacterium]|nr:TRAP transporter large permease [Pseudomonadota bacterium]MEE3102023.1 TRAP transporter large permease [Pseudomonadota bacterium]